MKPLPPELPIPSSVWDAGGVDLRVLTGILVELCGAEVRWVPF